MQVSPLAALEMAGRAGRGLTNNTEHFTEFARQHIQHWRNIVEVFHCIVV